MKTLRILCIAVTLCALSAVSAGAWNRAGHELVARIAWNRLDAAQRARLLEILRAHPAFPVWEKEAEAQHPPDFDAFVVGRAAAWPDDIKGRQPDNPFHVDDADVHADWHYIDNPLTFDGSPLRKVPRPNVYTALQWCHAQLRSPATPDAQRAIAMAWLLHLMGDVHQPLHCSERFSKATPRGDLGGNKWMVRLPDGSQKNLHAFWDDLAAARSDLVPGLAETLPATVRDLPPATDRAQAWIEESFRLGRQAAYADGRVPGLPLVDPKATVVVPDDATLSPSYIAVAARVARARALVAGLRLSHRLRAYL